MLGIACISKVPLPAPSQEGTFLFKVLHFEHTDLTQLKRTDAFRIPGFLTPEPYIVDPDNGFFSFAFNNSVSHTEYDGCPFSFS